jgi:D-alanine-D-alanine ligase
MEIAPMARNRKTRLCILFGGKSGEHEISLKSAASVISALDPEEFEIAVLGITQEGRFASENIVRGMLPSHLLDRVRLNGFALAGLRGLPAASGMPQTVKEDMQVQEIYFPLLHGPYGEDGTIQGLLEIANVPYIGCGVLASSVGMDKDVMKRLFLQSGLPVAPYRAVHIEELRRNPGALKRSLSKELGYPMFSKPANLGSSVGIRKIHTEKEFEASIEYAAQFDHKIVIERGLDARELECAVLGNRKAEASVVGEIIPAHEFYDYDAKYMSPDSRLVIPARIDSAKNKKIRDLAVRAFKAIDGSGLARVDFFLERKTGKIWVSEINTMPGFTPISMFAKLWDSSGITFGQLVHRLVALGYERFSEKNKRRISAV